MVCRCGLRWDVHDPDPPACNDKRQAPETPAAVDPASNPDATKGNAP
jgi:hypothetical protein